MRRCRAHGKTRFSRGSLDEALDINLGAETAKERQGSIEVHRRFGFKHPDDLDGEIPHGGGDEQGPCS